MQSKKELMLALGAIQNKQGLHITSLIYVHQDLLLLLPRIPYNDNLPH